MTDDGYMNEKHMNVVERSMLRLSDTREKFRKAADELEADGAEAHLVEALRNADRALESVYKNLFQSTYFHVSDDQMANAGKSRKAKADQPNE